MLDWYPLSFDSAGTLTFPDQIDGPDGIVTALTGQPGDLVTDLWILSYGWNTSIQDGDVFYNTWVDLLRSQILQANLQNTHPMFIGIFWPSEILADTSSRPDPPPAPAGLGTRENFIQAHRPIFDPELKQDDAVFAQDFGGVYDFIAAPDLTNQQQVSTFLATLKKYQQEDPHADQPVADNVIDTGADALATMLTTSLNALFPQAISNGLLDFLRVFSFWTMKGRAGIVGANGLAPFLAGFRTSAGQNNTALRIHLMGHSFGAKLLTAAVFGTASLHVPQPVVDTLILFQGAFSQFSFTRNIPGHADVTGFYADVVAQGMVSSPVTVIYSTEDLANATLYPIGMAPVLEQDVAALPPTIDPTQYHRSNEFRGSIGANGTQGFEDAQMYNVKLPWPGIDQNTLNTVSCINLNRTPFLDQNLNDPLVGIHNDYHEPEIFQAAVAISQLKPGNV